MSDSKSYPSFPCPKCRRSLDACGEVSLDAGPALPVYQCDDCVTPAEPGELQVEGALTFIVKDGRAFDPTDPNEPLNLGG